MLSLPYNSSVTCCLSSERAANSELRGKQKRGSVSISAEHQRDRDGLHHTNRAEVVAFYLWVESVQSDYSGAYHRIQMADVQDDTSGK